MRVYHPLWSTTESNFQSSGKWTILIKDAGDNFDNTGKKSSSYLEELSQKLKNLKGGIPPINPSPINNI